VSTVKAGEFVWRLAKPITRVKRALNKRRARKGKPLLEINQENDVKALIGALKSKTMWFGLAQAVVGAAAAFFETNLLPMLDGDPSALLVTAALTWLLRAVTTSPLADK
jgi:hypothetical protein